MFEQMDNAVKERWATALRSGKYKQGKGVLRDKMGRHCCLGVLCNLVDPNGWALKTVADGTVETVYVYANWPESEWLSAGMRSDFGISKAEHEMLTQLNDGLSEEAFGGPERRYTFLEIADVIETGIRPRSEGAIP